MMRSNRIMIPAGPAFEVQSRQVLMDGWKTKLSDQRLPFDATDDRRTHYGHEIVARSIKYPRKDSDTARRLGIRLVLSPGAHAKPALSQIELYRTNFGSAYAWYQLPCYGATSGVLSLGHFNPIFARNHIVHS